MEQQGFNYNSPIVQNIMGQGYQQPNPGYPYGQPQPQPYNGGYPYGYPPQTQSVSGIGYNYQYPYGQPQQQQAPAQPPQSSYYTPYQNYSQQPQPTQYYGGQYQQGYYGGQNYQYQNQMQDILYGSPQPGMDVNARLSGYLNQGDDKKEAFYAGGGYYDYYGNYRNYNMTPQQIYQMEQERQKQFMEYQQMMVERNKRLSRIAHGYFGEVLDEKLLSEVYDPKPVQTQPRQWTEKERKEYEEMAPIIQCYAMQQMLPYVDIAEEQLRLSIINETKKVTEAHDKMIDPNSDLIDFLNNAGKLYVESLLYDQKLKRKESQMQYDPNQFQNMANLRSSFINQGATIDDNVISLPARFKSEYNEKRKKFIDAIMNTGGGKDG